MNIFSYSAKHWVQRSVPTMLPHQRSRIPAPRTYGKCKFKFYLHSFDRQCGSLESLDHPMIPVAFYHSQHPDCLPIPVSQGDSHLGPLGVRCLEFVRSSPAPKENCDFGSREQLSQVTSYLDASMVYGSSVEHSDNVRLFRHGQLAIFS